MVERDSSYYQRFVSKRVDQINIIKIIINYNNLYNKKYVLMKFNKLTKQDFYGSF